MSNPNDDSQYISGLERGLEEYREEVRKAQTALNTAQERLEKAESFYKMELERLRHRETQPDLEQRGRFMGMAPLEACLQLLREHGEMTRAQLERELRKGGFQFKGSPKRIINMALLGRPNVERVGRLRFRLKE